MEGTKNWKGKKLEGVRTTLKVNDSNKHALISINENIYIGDNIKYQSLRRFCGSKILFFSDEKGGNSKQLVVVGSVKRGQL